MVDVLRRRGMKASLAKAASPVIAAMPIMHATVAIPRGDRRLMLAFMESPL
jgi:hypothetical protein